MYSDLELLVQDDMIINGYNPAEPEDVVKYWNERLS
jgi:hypothetical protein